MKKHTMPALLALFSILWGAGCSSANTENKIVVPTLGQQLIDLQKAKDGGVITPEQFEAKKAELLKK